LRIVLLLSDIPKGGVCAEGCTSPHTSGWCMPTMLHGGTHTMVGGEAYTRRRTTTMGGEAALCASLLTLNHGRRGSTLRRGLTLTMGGEAALCAEASLSPKGGCLPVTHS